MFNMLANVLDVGSGSEGYESEVVSRGSVSLDLGLPVKVPDNFIRGDAHHLPFATEAFSKVFLYDVIEHVDSPIKVLAEINRVLRVGGEIEISTPNPLHWRKFLRLLRGKKIELTPVPDHIYTWTNAELENILERTNFENVRITYRIVAVTRVVDHARVDGLADSLLHRFCSGVTGKSIIAKATKRGGR